MTHLNEKGVGKETEKSVSIQTPKTHYFVFFFSFFQNLEQPNIDQNVFHDYSAEWYNKLTN